MRKRLNPLHSTWPDADRAAWDALCGNRSFLDQTAPEQWRQETKRQAAYAYDRWLRFLGATDANVLNRPPIDRLDADSLKRFVEHLRQGARGKAVSDRTMASTLNHFINALRVIVPGHDRTWLLARKREFERHARSSTHTIPTTTAQELRDVARSLMADAPRAADPLEAARMYRDGLILELLLATTLRRRSFVSLTKGSSLQRTGNTYRITIAADDTKTGVPFHLVLDAHLTPYIERYITDYRPRFPEATTTDRLWLSTKGGALGEAALSQLVGRRTAVLGKRLTPHQFRHVVATAIASSPSGLRGASQVLQHANPTMTAGKYCLGDTLKASRELGRIIDTIRGRRDLVPLTLTPTSPFHSTTKGIDMN